MEENKRLINLEKLSNAIILGKSTVDTAMELDVEGAANYIQLKDLIQRECDKWDRKYARLEDKYNKLEQQVTHKDQQKTLHRGADSRATKEQAPRRKTNPFKNKDKTEEQTVQKARFLETKINQNKETPKINEKPQKNSDT